MRKEIPGKRISYRARTQFEAFTKYENGESEPVLVDWKLDGDFIPMGTKRGDILKQLGIQVKNYQIGCLTGSSTIHPGSTQTLFTSLLSGKVNLIAQHGKMAVSTTHHLSQPTVYCHFKQVEGFTAGDTKKQVETWITEANKLWGQEKLIEVSC